MVSKKKQKYTVVKHSFVRLGYKSLSWCNDWIIILD